MIFRFNKAQLGTEMGNALNTLLVELQKTQVEEIEVIADEFPYKLIVKNAKGELLPIIWQADKKQYAYLLDQDLKPFKEPEKIGEIKDWQRPEKAVTSPAPEPAPEINVTVDGVVSQFMGLPVDQRTKFFCEMWKAISDEEKKL